MCATLQVQPQVQSLGFQRILIPTDFSDNSRRAISYGLALARQYRADVHFVHAISHSSQAEGPIDPPVHKIDRQRFDAELQMKHLMESLVLGNLDPRSWIERGPIYDVLEAAVRRHDIDLLVFSTHSRGGLSKLVRGSVAEEMLRRMTCPVLTLGKQAKLSAGVPTFKRILLATDFGPGATRALPLVFALAEKCKSVLTLLHIFQPLPVVDGSAAFGTPANLANEFETWEVNQKDEIFLKLRQLVPPEATLSHEPNYAVSSDSAAHGILRAASQQNAGLIVMGVNQSSSARAAAHIPWSVAHQVICEANCPVLTVSG